MQEVSSIVPFEIRNVISVEEFSAKIKSLRPENCPFRVFDVNTLGGLHLAI